MNSAQAKAEAHFDAVHTERLDAEQAVQSSAEEAIRCRTEIETPVEDEKPAFTPATSNDRSQNPLRPSSLDQVVGQTRAKAMMRRVIDAASGRGDILDHVLMVGPAGTGKTTFANIIAIEMGRDCYQVSAPVSFETLMGLREVMKDGDVLFIDEIHMQAVAERRGGEAMSAPEVFLQLLEDFVIATPEGMVPFPHITVIGATTDPGRLPDPFLDRFPLQPRLEAYTGAELEQIAEFSARRLGMTLMPGVARRFGEAARGTPRIVNNYLKNAGALVGPDRYVMPIIADQVLGDLNGVTEEGLTPQMQDALTFLYTRCRHKRPDGQVVYKASVNGITTAIGLSRDTKAVQLRVEPFLIQRGLVQVGSGGRALTDAGVKRAKELAHA